MPNQSFRNLTILFVPTNGNENINSCQVLAEELRERGHRIVFAVDIASKGLLTPHGFEEEIQNSSKITDFSYKKNFQLNLDALNSSSIEKVKNFCLTDVLKKFEATKDREYYYEKLVERLKPDIIIVESMICSPALTNSGIPWVWLNFGAPNLPLNDDRIPPAWSGLPKNAKRQDWTAFREQWNEVFKDLNTELNEWCVSRGAPELPKNTFHPQSPYLNIYVYPKELDYKICDTWELRNWLQLDCLTKKPEDKFSIPQELMAKPGKLIYLSMGEFADSELMKRLTTILSKSQNKFIVSKGPFYDKYELPDNMWGKQMLPQTDVISSVDLIITNGDNQTISDAFYFAKPVVVLPLFGDQLDNGQRIKENGFGLSLDPYSCSKETLLCVINSMLDDPLLNRRMSMISYRMQNSDAKKQASLKIEHLLNI